MAYIAHKKQDLITLDSRKTTRSIKTRIRNPAQECSRAQIEVQSSYHTLHQVLNKCEIYTDLKVIIQENATPKKTLLLTRSDNFTNTVTDIISELIKKYPGSTRNRTTKE